MGSRKVIPAEERFWSKVERDPLGCWEWRGFRLPDGRGTFRPTTKRQDRKEIAARYSYKIANGAIPKGLFVCHACDNPGCVRPSHLWLGTALDNNRDSVAKGRANKAKGELHFRARLTSEQVQEIRTRNAQGEGYRRLAKDYPVGSKGIQAIVKRRTWKAVD